jgi:hypothetical protein
VRRAPTEKQMRDLLVLGNGSMIVSGRSRRYDALIRRGWALRALADAVELYGPPSFKAKGMLRHKVGA